MRLQTIATGSKGNCYILTDDSGESLILDVGVKSAEIKKALDFDFSKVSGVLCTHAHKDHSLSLPEMEMLGLDVFAPFLVDGGRDKRTFGKYAVQSFDLPHDGEPCVGFYIRHISGFKMLYLTDLEYCKYCFQKQEVNAILIECNWQKLYVDDLAANYLHKVLGHLSLENCIGFLKANQTDALRSVVICHMSNYTMDLNMCLDEIRQVVGENVRVSAAGKGKVIELC